MRAALLALSLTALPALAQTAISGTVTGTYEGSNGGPPLVRYDVTLACALICPPDMPLLTFHVRGGLESVFAQSYLENTGLQNAANASDLERDGRSTATTTLIRPGTVNQLIARGVTCECGSVMNQGGVLELRSAPFAVPPTLVVSDGVRAKSIFTVNVEAEPRGTEVVKVILNGAGLDEVVELRKADFPGNGAVIVRTPQVAGTVTVTASIGGAAVVRTATVVPAPAPVDAGPAPQGGGSGSAEPLGCQGAPAQALGVLGLLLLRRRR